MLPPWQLIRWPCVPAETGRIGLRGTAASQEGLPRLRLPGQGHDYIGVSVIGP